MQTAFGLDRDSKRRKRRRNADGRRGRVLELFSRGMIAILAAFLTCDVWNALRQMSCNTVDPAKTVERGTQNDLNPVDSIVIPTSAYCSEK